MKKLGQKTFNVIVSSLMMLALLPTNLTTINATGTTDVSSFDANLLGEAMNYGVVANSISLGAHMDSNFAAKEWNYNGNITLGQYTNQPGSIVVGNIKSNTLTVTSTTGKPYVKCATDQASKISFDKEQGVIVTDTEQNIDNYIDGLISPIVESAESMLNMTTLTYGVDFAKIGSKDANGNTIDANNYALDFTKYNDDVIYLHGASELLEAAKNMHIIKNDNQKIIFNIDNTSKTVTLNQFQVISNGVQYDSAAGTDEAKNTANESIAETIIFNMPNATVLNIASGITGTVLAPKASVSFSGTSCGWLICDKISGSSAEWHSIYKHVKNTVVPGNVKLTATKSVDGKEPTEDQIFDFTLSEYNENFESLITPTYAADNKTQYVNTKIVHNSGKDISMDLTELGFAQFNTVGTRYFKLTENDATGYEENNTAYYIVIDTTVSGGNATRTYTSTATIYSDYSKGVVYNGTMAFENKTTKPETKEAKVTKNWVGDDDNTAFRTAITARLHYSVDNKEYDHADYTLNEENGWSVDLKTLPKYHDGKEISYSWTEETTVDKYTSSSSVEGTTTTLTNTYNVEDVKATVKKTWDDNNNQYNVRPTSVTFQLQKTVDGKTSDVEDKTVVLNDENAWTYTFEDLPKYEGGKEITYSAVETSTDKNYTSEANGLTVKNTLITGKLVIKKTFAGTEIPDTAKNKLNFKVTGPNNYEKTISYAEFTNGEYTLDYILAGDYKVEEVNNVVDGYRAVVTYSVNGKTGQTASVDANTTPVFAITNTYVETPKTPTTPTPTPDRPTTPTTPDRPTTPNTGDQTNLPMAAAGMLFGTMAAMFVVFFKRKYSD